ncbi:hypothetical protein KKF97_06555 [Myxococcota bacterium]|nr:hypothetical protein [Myxococcota bacterium]
MACGFAAVFQGFGCGASLTPGYSKMVSFHDVRVPGLAGPSPITLD